jgi:hypothetical protein
MRHPYTPVFRDFLTSSMWATDPATRCVWIWFLLMADPEGFVVGTVPGVAQQAGVTLEQAKAAVDILESPDPYSSTPELEGRRLVKVARGWHIVNFVAYRERAKLEAEKARKRAWAKKDYDAKRQLTLPGIQTEPDLDAPSEPLDAPKQKPKPLLSSSPSTAREAELDEPGDDSGAAQPLVLRKLPENFELDDELHAEAKAAGVDKPDEWLDKLKEGPIGGARGVFAHRLRDYIRRQFPLWRTWEETDRAKDAQRQVAPAPARRFADKPVPVDPLEPEPRHEAFARQHGLDLDALVKGVLVDYPQQLAPPLSRRQLLGERLTVAAKQKRHGQPVTGKLTPAQLAQWGPVPTGGAIPEVA